MTFYVFLSCCTRFPQQWLPVQLLQHVTADVYVCVRLRTCYSLNLALSARFASQSDSSWRTSTHWSWDTATNRVSQGL